MLASKRAIVFLPAMFTVAFVLGIAASIFSAEAPQKVRIAYASRSSSAMPQYMALQKGYFKGEGLEVEIIQMNPRLGATAVVNGDVSFATPFTSVFRGVLQGFPIGVATIKGTDQLVAEEMLQAKGFNPNLLQAVAIGDGPVRMQALISGAVEAICVAPPHDLMLKKMGYPALAGPPEVGLPSAGMLTSDRLIKENPQVVRRTLKALLRAHRYILENRQDTIQTLIKWLPQPLDIAEHSYDGELKTLSKDGTMTDAEIEAIIARVGEKKRPLDEVRDFSFARQAMKELQTER